MWRYYPPRVSPFGNPRIKAWLAAPRGLSQPPTSFIASQSQGIHRMPLVAWSPLTRASRALARGDVQVEVEVQALRKARPTRRPRWSMHCYPSYSVVRELGPPRHRRARLPGREAPESW